MYLFDRGLLSLLKKENMFIECTKQQQYKYKEDKWWTFFTITCFFVDWPITILYSNVFKKEDNILLYATSLIIPFGIHVLSIIKLAIGRESP